jgi:23S rRNA pseudouridine955/2504/2580 synthase
MKKFIVDRTISLRDFTDSVYPQGSFALSALLRVGDVRVNGVKTKKDLKLNVGDEVVYYTTKKQEEVRSHSVVYEDENVLVVDKESGVSCEGLLAELNQNGDFYAVHRLDRNTCGLLVFAKNTAVYEVLLEAFKTKNVHKTYICIAKNAFKKDHECLISYLKKDEINSRVTVIDQPKSGFVKIITEYSVLEKKGDIALVEVTLHTGKTHQIRAHLAHIGCPILGDEKYGDEQLNRKYGAKRQKLVAKRLRFELIGEFAYLNDLRLESGFELKV